jgi:hypothetical protein
MAPRTKPSCTAEDSAAARPGDSAASAAIPGRIAAETNHRLMLQTMLAMAGGADWRATVAAASALAVLAAGLALLAGLGPAHARASGFDPGALRLAWIDRRIRLAYAGYLGHMWELYAFWAWIAAAGWR